MTLNNKLNEKGFTIVELLIVVVVIGILAAITLISYGNITGQARATAAADLAANVINTAQNINSLDGGNYPGTISGVWEDAAGTVSIDIGAAVTDGKIAWNAATTGIPAGVVYLSHICVGSGGTASYIRAYWSDAAGSPQTKAVGTDTGTEVATVCP